MKDSVPQWITRKIPMTAVESPPSASASVTPKLPACAGPTPFRVIAARLGMSLGAVQKSMRRHQALAVAGQLALVDALTADDVTSAEDVARLNPLERERLRHVAADSAPGVALAEYVATHPQPSCRHRPAVDPG
jgi:hypothetical protein